MTMDQQEQLEIGVSGMSILSRVCSLSCRLQEIKENLVGQVAQVESLESEGKPSPETVMEKLEMLSGLLHLCYNTTENIAEYVNEALVRLGK